MSDMALFEEHPVRRVFHEEEWWFVVFDIVGVLTDSPNPSDYLKKLRRRDSSLAEAFCQMVKIAFIESGRVTTESSISCAAS
jgi:prophage antirepressor-like protein